MIRKDGVVMVIRSIFDHSKLKQINNKWMKQEETKQKEEEKDLTPEMRQLRQYEEDMRRIREQRPKMEIDAKLKAGADLTLDEIEYLKKNDPEAYKEYEEIRREMENYKKQLKNCKTKEDVERLKMNKMGQFMAEAKSISQNPNIPKAKKLGMMEKVLKKTMGIQKEHIEFTKSLEYQSLPTQEEEREKEEKKKEKMQPEPTTQITEETEMFLEETQKELEENGEEIEKPEEKKPKREEMVEKKEIDLEQETEKKGSYQSTVDFEDVKTVVIAEMKRFLK